jgi:hypothetical protein
VYEQRGSRDKAIAEYRRFLSFWKDADTDLHEVKDARERVKTLAGNGNR